MSGGLDTAIGSGPRASASSRAEWSVPLVGLAAGLSGLAQRPDALLVTVCAGVTIAALVVWIVLQDLRTFTISDAALLTLVIVALVMRWMAAREDGESMSSTVLAAAAAGALPGGLLLLFRELYYRRKGFDGLGLGDVKLAVAGALLVGLVGFSWALFAASLLGLAVVVCARLLSTRPTNRFDRLAFGAVLAPALFVVWLLEQWPLPLPLIGS